MDKLTPLLLALTLLAGCASTDTFTDTVDEPKFTPAEKAAMTDEEKLKTYNANRSEDDKLICTYDKLTGSRLKRKVCLTRQEREQIRVSSQDELRRKQSGFNCDGAGSCQTGGI